MIITIGASVWTFADRQGQADRRNGKDVELVGKSHTNGKAIGITYVIGGVLECAAEVKSLADGMPSA